MLALSNANGLIILDDLDGYSAVWREPLGAPCRDFDLLAAPPSSSGGFAVVQLLRMRDDLIRDFAGLAHNSPQYIHLVSETEKRVFADRAA